MNYNSILPARALAVATICALGALLAPTASADDYQPLLAALDEKKRMTLAEAQEAQLLIAGYEEFLADPELASEERPELRRSLIKERARYKLRRAQAGRIQVAVQELRRVPIDEHVTIASLREVYSGLDVLATQGKAAWDEVLANRNGFVNDLEREYKEQRRKAQSTLRDMNVEEQATQFLVEAINPDNGTSTDAEFFVALKLPAVKAAVERGFRITPDPKDPRRQAQTTLLALIAYSQFFWDHYGGERALFTEEELPSDRRRNIFGVPDGKVLTSGVISSNNSHFYDLAPEARDRFNARLKSIWGDEAVAVATWNQKYDEPFAQACRALATMSDEYLVPNQEVFTLLEKIELLLNELELVTKTIARLDSSYQDQLTKAKQFGDKARLSTTHYNAQIWSREAERLLRGFEQGTALLDHQLKASAAANWTPDARGISESSLVIAKAQKRFYAVRKVKRELRELLGQPAPAGIPTPDPAPAEPGSDPGKSPGDRDAPGTGSPLPAPVPPLPETEPAPLPPL